MGLKKVDGDARGVPVAELTPEEQLQLRIWRTIRALLYNDVHQQGSMGRIL